MYYTYIYMLTLYSKLRFTYHMQDKMKIYKKEISSNILQFKWINYITQCI